MTHAKFFIDDLPFTIARNQNEEIYQCDEKPLLRAFHVQQWLRLQEQNESYCQYLYHKAPLQ